MKCKVVYLEPVGVGAVKSDLRSDSLWGSLCWAIRLLHGEAALLTFLHNYEQHQLILSSAFPYSEKDGRKFCFFPMPILPERKREKEVSRATTPGEIKIEMRKDDEEDAAYLLDTQLKSWVEEISKAKRDVKPSSAPEPFRRPTTHNTINRLYGGTLSIGEQGQLFHTDDQFLEPKAGEKAGWYFLLQGNDLEELIIPALRFWEHNGIGGDRSIGKGHFRIEIADYKLSTPASDEANAMMTLSLYRPLPAELEQMAQHPHLHAYALESRQGRTLWRDQKRLDKSLLYFREGSVFPLLQSERGLYGATEQVGQLDEETPIYRYGHAFMIHLQIPE